MNVQFQQDPRSGIHLPFHCGRMIRFGVLTCRCQECNQSFNTLEVDAAMMAANGLQPQTPQESMADIVVAGLLCRSPIHAPEARKITSPAAELAAESEALAAIAKARGK